MKEEEDSSPRYAKSIRTVVKRGKERWISYFTAKIVARPWTIIWTTVFAFLVAVALLIAVGTRQSPATIYDWELPDQKFSMRRDMIDDASDRVDQSLLPERSDQTLEWYFFYDADPNNYANKCDGPLGVISPRNLQESCKAEQILWSREKWVEKFCYLTYPQGSDQGYCAAPADSVVTLFYQVPTGTPLVNASYYLEDCPLLDENQIFDVWESIQRDWNAYNFYFDEEALERGYPCKSRSVLYIGTPLEGETEIPSYEDRQMNKIEKQLVKRTEDDLLSEYNMKPKILRSAYLSRARAGESGKQMDILWWNAFVENSQFEQTVDSDFTLAICSILFVWLWISVHTASAIIGTISILQIVLSLPFSLFFYRVILQIKFISVMQNLVVFVILGIGADDVFVYYDAWRQSNAKVPAEATGNERLRQRVKYAYSRAFQSIFNTSFTTAVAFCATAIAELVPIATFGIFAAICVIMNFALVLTITPAVVIIHNRNFVDTKKKKKNKQNINEKHDKVAHDDDEEQEEQEEPPVTKKKRFECCTCSVFNEEIWVRNYLSFLTCGGNETTRSSIEKEPEFHPITPKTLEEEERKLKPPTFRNKPVAWLLVVSLAAYACTMCALASRLRPPSQPEVWFTSEHMNTRTDKLFDGVYGSNEAGFYPTLAVVWGMDRLVRKNFDPYVPHRNRGEVRFSNPPQLHLDESQDQVLEACSALRTFVCKSGCVDENLVRPNSTVCFLEQFQDWHQNTYGVSTYGLGETVFNQRLSTFRDETTPISEENVIATWKDLIGFVDGEFRFFRIDARLSLDLEGSIERKEQVIRRTNKYISRHCRNRDANLPDVWQYSDAWVWFKAQAALVNGLLVGMAIAFPVAFVVLTSATQNIILAFFAIATIGSIVGSVLGLAYLFGWALGVKESIAGVVVIGLAVDYTIHIGHVYDVGREEGLITREEKTIAAVWAMGPTIVAGAVTTAGAALFLLFAQLTFFTQMSILILATIISSLIYSLFFFVPLLYVLGPQADIGSIHTIQHFISDKCCACCSGRSAEAPTTSTDIDKAPSPTYDDNIEGQDQDEKEEA